jgi:hypothetical protein
MPSLSHLIVGALLVMVLYAIYKGIGFEAGIENPFFKFFFRTKDK